MRMSFSVILTFVVLLLPCSAGASPFDGPFQVKNQFPLFLPVNQPYLDQAATESSLSLSLSHSSVYMIKDSATWSAGLDIEMTELNVRYKKDIPGRFEFGLDVPALRATGGFMDRPLAWYHRAFGFPDYGRSERPRNEFLYTIRKDGAVLIQGENDKAGLGDVRVSLKKKMIEDPRLTVSAQVDVEFPTGNARTGYGNGSLDAAVGLLLDREVSGETRFHAGIGAVFPGDLKAYQTVNLENFYYAGAAVEYLFWADLGLLAQFMVQTSPYPDTGISEIDTAAMLLVLGGRYYTGHGSYEFSLTEDPNTSGAPDFILNLTYKKRF